MRKLKFRAWDTHSKGMHPGFTLQEIVQIMRNPEPPGIEAVAYQFAFNELIFMQYTGLKDKNGKEIYEGDILKIANMEFSHFENSGVPDSPNEIFEDIIGQVSFSEGWFVVDGHSAGEMPLNAPNADDIEVIGNIYSNPELLKA